MSMQTDQWRKVFDKLEKIIVIERLVDQSVDIEAWTKAVVLWYAVHGAPFGLSIQAIAIWLRFKQSTTNN